MIFNYQLLAQNNVRCSPIAISWDNETPYTGIDNWSTIASSSSSYVQNDDINISLVSTPYGLPFDKTKVYGSSYGEDGCINFRFEKSGVYKIMVGNDYVLLRVRSMVPMFNFGGYAFNTSKNCIPINVFKAQKGIYRTLECCNYSQICETIGFDLVVSGWEGSKIYHNETGTFSDELQEKIQELDINDIVSIVNIRYRCPGDELDKSYFDKTFIFCSNYHIFGN